MEGTLNTNGSEKMNMEYWDEYMELSKKAREAWEAAEQADVEATQAATTTTETWGLVWPLEEKLKELVQVGASAEEISKVQEEYEIALQNFEEAHKKLMGK